MKERINHNRQKHYTTTAMQAVSTELFGDIDINDYITVLFFSSLLAVLASVALYMFCVYCI